MIDSARAWLGAVPAAGAGSGFTVYPVLSALAAQLAPVRADFQPHAREIAMLAAHDGLRLAVPPEQAVPVYVRNAVAMVSGQPP